MARVERALSFKRMQRRREEGESQPHSEKGDIPQGPLSSQKGQERAEAEEGRRGGSGGAGVQRVCTTGGASEWRAHRRDL